MNETAGPISILEKRTILVFALLATIFFLSSFAEDAIRRYQDSVSNHSKINFAVDDPAPRVPAGLNLMTIPILLSLIRPRRFLIPTLLAAIYAGLLLMSFHVRVNGESFFGARIPGDPNFLEELFLKTWIWDYAASGFLIILLPWLFSILNRLHKQHIRKAAKL